jgi:hypothetical protein
MPDLETPYSKASLSNINHAVELEGESINAIVNEREQ